MFTEYGSLSTQMYEITKPVGHSLGGDIAFYTKLLAEVKGTILEAGVGTGRLLIPLLQKGLSVVGVDVSEEMLTVCRKNLADHQLNAPLYQQDLQALSLPDRFERIVMPTGSFALLPGRQAALQTLKRFYEHLAPKGQIIIDLELPADFTPGEVFTQHIPLSPERGILFTSISQQMDWQAQQTSYLHRYELWEKGQLVDSELSHFELSWYGMEEFQDMLAIAGFHSIQVCYEYGHSETYQTIATFLATK